MPDTQINIQSEETVVEFTQEQVAIEFVQEEVQLEFIQETTQIDFVSENIVLNLTGVPGPQGPPGVGVPAGGDSGQVLAKIDGDDYNTEWVDQSGGGHEIQDEGDALPAQPALNFIGAGVTVTDNPGNGTTDVTIPGGGGGAASITEITYADIETALQNATLTPGQFYNITDAGGTDLGFICQAVKADEITVNGTGGYLNADFQGVGDYSGATRPATNSFIYYYDAIGPFSVGETITGTDNGSTAVVVSDDEDGTLEVSDVSGDWNTETEFSGDMSGNTAIADGYDEALPEIAPGSQLGIWRKSFEAVAIPYTNLSPDFVEYTSGGNLEDGETFSTNLGGNGTIIHDDGAVVTLVTSFALVAGEVITGDNSGNTVTVDAYTSGFSAGDTITGGTTGATAVIIADDGSSSITAYMTSAGLAFDGSEILDNGNGVTADMDGSAGSPTIAQGDFVIWNLLHYQLTDLALLNGTNPAQNSDAYRELQKRDEETNELNTGQGYIEAWDFSFFSDGQIIGREDPLQNKIYGQYVSEFKWGGTDSGNICNRGSIISKNSYGNISGNTVFEEASIDVGNNNVSVRKNVLYSLSRIGGITTHGQSSADIGNNIFLPSSYIDNISTFAELQIGYSTLRPAVTITEATIKDSTTILQCEIKQSWFEVDFEKSGGLELSSCFFGNALNSLTISDSIISKTSDPGFSDIPGTIDITGLTTLDITAEWAQYRGIINLTSDNATESIDTITNPPTLFPFILRPAAGLALTITGTAYAGIGAGQIALKATDYTLDGDKGEYIVLEIDPLGTGCLVEKYVVNGLI